MAPPPRRSARAASKAASVKSEESQATYQEAARSVGPPIGQHRPILPKPATIAPAVPSPIAPTTVQVPKKTNGVGKLGVKTASGPPGAVSVATAAEVSSKRTAKPTRNPSAPKEKAKNPAKPTKSAKSAKPATSLQASNMDANGKRSRDEEDIAQDEIITINAGLSADKIVRNRIARSELDELLKRVPKLAKYMTSPDATTITINDCKGESLTVILKWVIDKKLHPLGYGEPGQQSRSSNWDWVDVYAMADKLRLPGLCDEIIDAVKKAFWVPDENGEDSGKGLVANLDQIATAYARTDPTSPLRVFMVRSLHLILHECVDEISIQNEFTTTKISACMNSSIDLIEDYVNYTREMSSTKRNVITNPADPRMWNTPCDLHQHLPCQYKNCYLYKEPRK